MTLSKKKYARIIISVLFIIFLAKLFNINSFVYAVQPEKAFKQKRIATLQVDNIGVGRFDLIEVVEFIKNDLSWEPEQVYVFGGRYGEFILLLDYNIDRNRCLQRDQIGKYDVGRNMYVESSYFQYHELQHAVNTNDSGYYVTQDKYITSIEGAKILDLQDSDFSLFGTRFTFVKNINNVRIYRWE